jgi:hypothetical protein
MTGGWKVWHYILAVIFFLGALWGFIRPADLLDLVLGGLDGVVPGRGPALALICLRIMGLFHGRLVSPEYEKVERG